MPGESLTLAAWGGFAHDGQEERFSILASRIDKNISCVHNRHLRWRGCPCLSTVIKTDTGYPRAELWQVYREDENRGQIRAMQGCECSIYVKLDRPG